MNISLLAVAIPALIVLTPLAEATDPVVSNISAVQRAGTQLVDITYDVSANTSTVSVGLEISSDGGTTYSVPAVTPSGAIGFGVATGMGKVITWNAGADWNKQYSAAMCFKVTAYPQLSGYSAIPTGSFQMGNAMAADTDITDAPIRTVTVSAFYMGQNLVTKADWDTVRTWGLAHGYTDLSAGAGKAINHPVQTVSWYDMVKWCNARSEMEGLSPCYTLSGVVYRTTSNSAVACDWSSNGYRLPTEAEWEKAARGGMSGKRFPWGDTISHANANFNNNGGESYQTGATGYDPVWGTGSIPYTSPVGSYAANGYGLYDMAGNVVAWCWDWYGSYAAGAQTDPRGAASGPNRVNRGGLWSYGAYGSRVAFRNPTAPSTTHNDIGFRVARSSVQANPGFAITPNVTVDTRSSVATLSALALSSGSLAPTFVSSTKVYTASVTNAIISMTLIPTVTDATATIKVNGTMVTSGVASGAISLVVGTNVITTVVTAQDGTTTSTYTLTVTRAALPVVSNISAVQRPGTQLVDITYDVTADTSTVPVGLEISSDGGTTYSVPVVTPCGAIGFDVATGTGNVITWDAGADWSKQYSSAIRFKVTAYAQLSGFSAIPVGSFQMGNAMAEDTDITNAPIRTVTVSALYMGQNLVTKAEWDTVRTWGLAHGYTDLAVGAGKAINHPVQTVSWYNVVKWCNARSEMEGLTPCYTLAGAVYRTTNNSAVVCDWSASGYRLPTEAEWEKAARGGLSGKRFPWGDRISQSQANYNGNPTSYAYDDGPAGYNSIGSIGGTNPATSPVGSFVVNGYGLYDMAGNVMEWCWDWYGAYAAGVQTDPRGVASGTTRVLRGGDWYYGAGSSRVAYRSLNNPTNSYNDFGFRVARISTALVGSGFAITPNVTVDTRSSVATLSALELSSGTLSPAFAAETLIYTASVANFPASVTVTPTVSDITATVKVNGTTLGSGEAGASIPLVVGVNNITVLITAQDGITISTYTVAVTRAPSSVSTLSGLTLSSGTLSPSFAAGTKIYSASVPNATTGVTVTPTVTDATATITVNGTPVTSGTASALIPISVGTNPITVLVTAQDGTTTSTYTVTVTRLSSDTSLSGLALSTGMLSPAFATGTLAYTASLANTTTGLTVTPTVSHPAATVKVNGVSVATGSASASIPLAVGPNAITVLVTAQDPAFTTTYTVTVSRPPLVATFTSVTTVPCTMASFTTPVNEVVLSLGYVPTAGTNLMVVRNTGLDFIAGRFSNLAHGQDVTLPYNNDTYRFVANYYGGTGNDLVLQWADNKAYTWGSNSLGQLGNTDSTSSSVPLAVTTSDVLADKTFVSIAVGSSHSVALCSDGTVATWGNNTYGQLGDGTNNNSNVPVAVTRSSGTALYNKTVVAVAAGFNHSLALCSDGTVAAWGFNSSGQLGNSNTTSSNVPVAVTRSNGTALYNKTVVAIAAGYNHSLARCADGAVATWGNNAYGQLGNNTTSNSNVPVNITTSGELNGRTVLFLVGGSDHSIGLCSDGSLVSWGRNNYGQLGNDSLINSGLPVVVDASDVLAGKVITAIATGGWHTLALCSDGTLAAFGRNNNGQLGNNSATDSSVPVRVVTATGTLFNKTITAIGGSNAHSLALCADGTLAAWGSNNNGQLGNDLTITSSNVPIAVTRSTLGSGEKFTDLATGSSASHVMALAAFHVSSNSTLSGLALSSGSLSPTFTAGTTAYAASVSNAATSVTITPSVADANATVKVNGVTVASGTASASIPLVVGDNPISVVATAQDGISLTTYTVTVTRVSTVSTLSGLALSAGSLNPAFATGTTAYTASVTASAIAVTPTVTDSNATVKVNGVTVASGVTSDSIPLVVGINPITVRVTAQDGTTQSTYTVTVTRLSTVSTLAGLAISPGTLSPAFATGTTTYMAIMPATATGVAVTPTASDLTSTIKVNGTSVASGTTSATIPITDTQTIATVVTAQDGSTTPYTLTVAFSGFEAWQTRVFTDPADLNDPAISGELETPAHDGVTNLMKYALALDPMICGTAGLPTVAQQDGYLTLTYRKNKTATDVTYTVQAADDLTVNAWAPATSVVSQTDQGDHWLVTVRDTVPYASHPQRFMRLQVVK